MNITLDELETLCFLLFGSTGNVTEDTDGEVIIYTGKIAAPVTAELVPFEG
jgi:hypothetical protein